MQQSFSEYLDSFEKRLTEPKKKPQITVAPKKVIVSESSKTIKPVVKKVEESNSSMTVCTHCGWNIDVILESCSWCPKCGRTSLKFVSGSNKATNKTIKSTNPTNKNESVSYANSLLDDDCDERPTRSLIEDMMIPKKSALIQEIENRYNQSPNTSYQAPTHQSNMAEHAADLMDDVPEVSMGFIPMPDFSQFQKKFLQESPTHSQPIADIPPEMQLISVPQPTIDPEIERQMRELGLN